MRSGGWSVQQALAADAAALMRQAVTAARRRGHAQVTPLHVAAAALADGVAGGLLRAACLRSRCPPGSSGSSSHAALQCKALELCLNVALSRLATAAGGVFGSFQQPRAPPALSNALAAALKRAQASQRRGGGGVGAEGQQQVAAGKKIELEQLVVSILDDPSVSRVMREAGFCSAEVKANVEKAAVVVSTEPPLSPTNTGGSAASPNPPPNTKGARPDVAARVLDCMAASAGRRRCAVVVGESAAAAEGVVKSVMDTVSKGELLQPRHERLRHIEFVRLSLASFRRAAREEEVEAGAGELRALVRRGAAAGKGVVLVLEDLGLAASAWAAAAASRGRSDHHYCPVEYAVMELTRLLCGDHDHDHDRFWLLAFGDHASYAACKVGQPSLESVLEMHPVVVQQGGGLVASSLGGDSELTFCGTETVSAAPASVPSWHRLCQGPVLSGSELTLSFSSPAAASSILGVTQYNPNMIQNPWHDPLSDQRQQLWPLNHRHDGPVTESHSHHDQQWPASPTPGSYSSSASKSISSEAAIARRRRPRFTELTAENLKVLCGALEARVPRHGAVAPGVASAVLRRRSGVTKTRRITAAARPPSSSPAATWLLFQGPDGDGKAAVARELARLVFGSYDAFTIISSATGFAKEPVDHSSSWNSGGRRLKRPRSSSPEKQEPAGYMQMFHDAIRENPHRVVLIDGIDDDDSEAGFIKSAIATGTVRSSNGVDVASLEDAIVVLSCDVFESRSRAPSPRRRRLKQPCADIIGSEEDDDVGTERGVTRPRFSLDLNACAVDDGELEEEGGSLDGVEILDAVDGVFFFQ